MLPVQSLLFERSMFSIGTALDWAHAKGFNVRKLPEVTEKFIHLRLMEPKVFVRFFTVKLAPGVTALVGQVKKPTNNEIRKIVKGWSK